MWISGNDSTESELEDVHTLVSEPCVRKVTNLKGCISEGVPAERGNLHTPSLNFSPLLCRFASLHPLTDHTSPFLTQVL